MISHKHKLIFIHIPRTAGTSIEKALHGKDWHYVHSPSKHLTVHSAKKIYAEYWNDYFKFSFVRNPWDRMVSLLKYGWFYGISLDNKKILRPEKYFKDFHKIEYDKRYFNENQFSDYTNVKESVYKNIIEGEMNFIGRFESLEKDFKKICEINNIKNVKLPHMEKSPNRKEYREYYDTNVHKLIERKYKKDIAEFHYEF